MPDPDPLQARREALLREIEVLRREIRTMPVGSPERDSLAVRIGELAGAAIALGEELHE